jgi:hypothetical protein
MIAFVWLRTKVIQRCLGSAGRLGFAGIASAGRPEYAAGHEAEISISKTGGILCDANGSECPV